VRSARSFRLLGCSTCLRSWRTSCSCFWRVSCTRLARPDDRHVNRGDTGSTLTASRMASILLVGGDEALLEGLAQMLAHAGHVPHAAHSVPDAIEVAASARPLVAIIERNLALANPEVARLP